MFNAQSRAKTVNLRISLANSQKGSQSTAEFFGKIRALADEMKGTGKKVDKETLSPTS